METDRLNDEGSNRLNDEESELIYVNYKIGPNGNVMVTSRNGELNPELQKCIASALHPALTDVRLYVQRQYPGRKVIRISGELGVRIE